MINTKFRTSFVSAIHLVFFACTGSVIYSNEMTCHFFLKHVCWAGGWLFCLQITDCLHVSTVAGQLGRVWFSQFAKLLVLLTSGSKNKIMKIEGKEKSKYLHLRCHLGPFAKIHI